jgi:ABC-type multidrug transport system ATPase subunit
MLCGEEGSIDISDFLTEEIKGPSDFKCSGNACSFEEPAMNELILSVFGDSSITIDCKSGECLYHSQIPGAPIDKKPSYKVFMIVAFSTITVFFIVLGIWLYNVSKSKKDSGYVPVDFDDEADKLMSHHVPSTLVFEDVSYSVGEKLILYNITGIVEPGEMMAIMGASGAGKTSFLDILARRNKTGNVNGTFYVNGKSIGDREFRKVVGYVDQEDTLMPTLTVFETIMTSALLRLPREMSYEAKKGRVMETMSELGILGIKDCRIGNSAARGISGGEKRRVSIACELVTSPSILFLDEPTSGLDAYNAYNVIESLKTLARDYKRTIIFTIHQPRSNIYTMFDKLLLLASGNMVYSGPANFTTDYLDSIDHPCPAGFNVADYLLDWTQEPQSRDSESGRAHLLTGISSMPSIGLGSSTLEGDLESQTEPNVWGDASDGPSRMITNEPESIPTISNSIPDDEDYLSKLVKLFKESDLYTNMITSIEGIKAQDNEDAQSTHSSIGRGYKRSSWFTQFKILSTRTFKNLYRDPLLMLANYCMSVLLGLLCGILYFHTTDDISGFQNRMGVFFFMCALFGFSCLTSLQVFQPERILFMRERANGYYAPITYFSSKIIFDIIPLRLIPPVLMGVIVYPMVGLNPGAVPFFKFLLILILFNLTASSVVFLIGILVSDLSLSNLICSLIMLFNMLFSGLFLNKTSIPPYLKWLKEFSFFNFALESMLVNELKYMQLKDNKFGLVIDIPGASILSSFGFDASAFWPDTIKLGVMFIVMIILSFISLQLFVKEKR